MRIRAAATAPQTSSANLVFGDLRGLFGLERERKRETERERGKGSRQVVGQDPSACVRACLFRKTNIALLFPGVISRTFPTSEVVVSLFKQVRLLFPRRKDIRETLDVPAGKHYILLDIWLLQQHTMCSSAHESVRTKGGGERKRRPRPKMMKRKRRQRVRERDVGSS